MMPKLNFGMLVSLTSKTSTLGAKVHNFKLPAAPVQLVSTVTTGIIAYEGQVSPPTVVNGWSGTWQTIFDEYRIIKATVSLRPVGLNTGESIFFIVDGTGSLGTPTYLEAFARPHKMLNNNVQLFEKKNNSLIWSGRDFTDLTWRSCGTGYNPFHYYVYTDNSNLGSSTTATITWIVDVELTIQFRGVYAN
jgi:hypothetical protein